MVTLALGCRGARPASAPQHDAAPVPSPALGISGCVESDELLGFVSALDAERSSARGAAVAALGARLEEKRGIFLEPALEARVDSVVEAGGKRFAVVAQLAPGFEPVVTIAWQGAELRRVDERPEAHGVPVVVCGVTPCPRARGGERQEVRAVGVELGPGETLGAPLVVSYDYWWAQVTYPKRARCDAPQVSVR